MKNGWKMDEKWMKHGWTKTWCTPLYAQFIIQSPVRNSKFESSYVIMFLFQLATFWETLLLCGFALLVGHDATTHEVTLQGPPVIVDHLKVEIIALLHGFSRIPMRKRQVIPTWPLWFFHETWWNMTHDGSMVLYMVTWIPSIYPSHVSIYTRHGSYGWWNHVIVLNIVKIYMNPCFTKSGRGVFSKARRKLEADSAGGSW